MRICDKCGEDAKQTNLEDGEWICNECYFSTGDGLDRLDEPSGRDRM